MPRWEKTNLTRSTNLRNAMQAKGYDTTIQVGYKFYEADGTLHLAVAEIDGFIVSVTQGTTFTEMFQQGENLARCFIMPELEAWAFRNIRVESSNVEQLANGNFRYRITAGGTAFTGTANTATNALAECLVNVLNSANTEIFRMQ